MLKITQIAAENLDMLEWNRVNSPQEECCPRKIAIHCHGGKGRTGWVLSVMKKALSPINGVDWETLVRELGEDYKKEAEEEFKGNSECEK